MRPEEFFARLEKIERVLQAVKASPADPAKWGALIAIAYSELDWAVRLMRHCSANILDEDEVDTASRAPARALSRRSQVTTVRPPTSIAAQIMERLNQIEQHQKETDARLADAELSGTWAIPTD